MWIDHPDATTRDIHHVAFGVFGPDVRTHLPERIGQHPLFANDAQPPRESIDAISVELSPIVELLVRRAAATSWSPSISWLHHATLAAIDIAATGRVLPAIRTAGLRWRADWTPVRDVQFDSVAAALTSIVPPVLISGSDKPPSSQVSDILDTLVDAICRMALREEDWRPPLPRTRASTVVALRRITTALSKQDAVFLGDSVAHESAFAEWSTQLSEYASVIVGAPEVTLQGRLEPPPEESTTESWSLIFEIVDAEGTAIGFSDVWAESPAAIALADGSSLGPLRTRMRDLIERLATQLAAFAPLADEHEPAVLELHRADVSDLLSDGLETCRLAGLPILTPTSLLSRSARLTARASSSSSFGGSQGLGTALVDVDWGLALGDIQLTVEEIEALAKSNAELVALRGSWVQIDRRQMQAALRRLDTQRRDASELSPAELLRQTISELERSGDDDLTAEGWIAQLLEGLPDDQLSEATEPEGFEGVLRPYQRRALGWLQFLGRLGLGGCLADDMGLGKTPTALAHLLARSLDRAARGTTHIPHLVICPLSVVTNWESEAARFTPELSVMIAHGPDRPRGARLVAAAANHDIIVTTYGTASRIAAELDPIEWDVVVCDEAQAIKNHRTNAATAIRGLRSTQRIALTGTPVENRLTELWAILDALNPGMLGGITWFRETFSNPIESGEGADALESLRRLTAPFVLRRSKVDRSLVPDLPDKIEQVAWAPLTPEQAGLYQAVVDNFLTTAAAATGMERRGLVLATLTRLKQVCNHPAHFLREGSVGGNGRSGKLDRFDELVDTLLESNERALVFTQYREMGTLLADHMGERLGFLVPFLHGGTTRMQRQRMVDSFQAQDGPAIQLISLRAGGTGLNLTAASRVIHYDRWWNPAVEDQATDRSWRIGQDKTVFVHKLVCRGTLEERIDSLLSEKRALADAVVGTDDSWLTELSTDELRDLLRLDPSAHANANEWELEQ